MKFFTPEMEFVNFIPADGIDGNISESEIIYLSSLIDHCQSKEITPILSCTRSLGRAPAIKKAFGCKNILIYRNIFHQWGSYCHQKSCGNPYFINTIENTLANSHHDPFIKSIDNLRLSYQNDNELDRLFLSFFLLHLYLYAKSIETFDLVIDTSCLVNDDDARKATEIQLSSMVGSSVDLSDATISFQSSELCVGNKTIFDDTVSQMIKIITEDSTLSKRAIDFIFKAKDETLSEMDRYEFYCRGIRSLYIRQQENPNAERDKLAAELTQTKTERDQLGAQIPQIKAERAQFATLVTHTKTERDQFAALVTQIKAERDQFAALVTQIKAERDQAVAKLKQIKIERDHIANQLNQIKIEQNKIEDQIENIKAEKDLEMKK